MRYHRARSGLWIPGERNYPLPPIAGGTDFAFVSGQGVDAYGAQGTGLTTAAANTKGAWTQIASSTTSPYVGLMVNINLNGNTSYFVDLGFGASGSEAAFVSNLFVFQGTDGRVSNSTVYLPVYVPLGTRLSARQQTAGGGGSQAILSINGIIGDTKQSDIINAIETGGANAGSTTGTSFTCTGTGTGSWVQLVASTTFPYKRVMLMFGDMTTTPGDIYWDLGVGASGSEKVVINQAWQWSFSNGIISNGIWNIPLQIPAGTRVAVRANAGSTSGIGMQGVMYGMA